MAYIDRLSIAEALDNRGNVVASGSAEILSDGKFSNPKNHAIKIYAASQLDEEGRLLNQTQEIVVFGKENVQRLRDLCDKVLNVGDSHAV